MTWAPMTHRPREPYRGPRRHVVKVRTQEAHGFWVESFVEGRDAEVIAFLKALVAELEGCTVSS